MDKTIMMLGAGFLQLSGIKMAKEMGLKVIVTDRNPNAPGLKLADIPRAIDLKDVEKTLQLAREFNVDGVLSNVTDVGVYTAAVVAEELGLVGITPKAAKAAVNKAIMRRVWKDAGLPVPRFKRITSLNEAYEAAEEIGFPLIVKPTDRSGSRGISRVDEKSGIPSAFKFAIESSFEKQVLVEELMTGTEHSVEAVTYKGTTHILGISDKTKTAPPYRFDKAVTYPSTLHEEMQQDMRRIVKDAIESLGIHVGPTHTEVCVTEDGPKLIEIHARCGGGNITSHIIPYITGVNMMKEVIKICLGLEPTLTPSYSRAAELRFIVCPPGKVLNISGLDVIKKRKWIIDVWFRLKTGDTVNLTVDGPGRAGHIIAVGDTREEVIRRADEAEKIIKIEVS